MASAVEKPVRLHPCVVQYGRCDYGSRCRFAQFPGDTCLMYLRGTCTRRGACWYRHDVGPGGCIEKDAPVVIEGKGVVKRVAKGLAVVAQPDDATAAKLAQRAAAPKPMIQDKTVKRSNVALEIAYGAGNEAELVKVSASASKLVDPNVKRPRGESPGAGDSTSFFAREGGGDATLPPHHPLTAADLDVEGEEEDAGWGDDPTGAPSAGYYDENGVWYDADSGCYVFPDQHPEKGATHSNPYAGWAPTGPGDAGRSGGSAPEGNPYAGWAPPKDADPSAPEQAGCGAWGGPEMAGGYADWEGEWGEQAMPAPHVDPFGDTGFGGFWADAKAEAERAEEEKAAVKKDIKSLEAFPTLGGAPAATKGKRVQAGDKKQELKVVTRQPRAAAAAAAATPDSAPGETTPAPVGKTPEPSGSTLKANAAAFQPPVYRLAATGAPVSKAPGPKPAPKVVRLAPSQPPVGTKAAAKPRPKLHPCVAQLGSCRYGKKCEYINMPADTCLMYLQGRCKFGDKCRNRHSRTSV